MSGVIVVVAAVVVVFVHGAVMHNKIRIYSGARLSLPPLTSSPDFGFILFADPYQTRKVTCPTTKDDDAHRSRLADNRQDGACRVSGEADPQKRQAAKPRQSSVQSLVSTLAASQPISCHKYFVFRLGHFVMG